MNLSMKWLKEYVDVECDIKDFVHAMTMSGSKVEGFEVEGEKISNVVVGKILEKNPHENADSLFVCKVDIGQDEKIQIVTNAKNIQVDDLVPVALDGATLPDGKIKKTKMRGVESFGMFCGLDTLGVTLNDFPYADANGVIVLQENLEEISLGMDIKKALGLDDISVEFEITSNRPDCLSVLGLAREAHATFNKEMTVKEPKFVGNNEKASDYVNIDVQNKELCSRYIAGVVKNVKISPSPMWLRERLRASNVRPINNLVDITNYVMLEYGHPMHAFDFKYINGGKIVVRNAKKDEKITTLDGVERELSEEMLMICDENKPVAVAGVMGGEFSGIMPDTQTVVFESACFDGSSVRSTAKKLGLRSDSSARFEKGLNPYNCTAAINRALELVELLGCGEVVGGLSDNNFSVDTRQKAPFNAEWISKFLGVEIAENVQIEYLNRLGFEVKDGFAIAPYDRIDIECAADIAEEVARIYGYNNIQPTLFKSTANAKLTPMQKFTQKIENAMTAVGYNEIATFSFVSPKIFDKINLSVDSELRKTVTILNPLGEDTSVMRTTAIPSILETLARNYNFKNAEASLFEIATEYTPKSINELPDENQVLILGGYGKDYDFYSIKGALEEFFAELNIGDVEYEALCEADTIAEKIAFHPGRSAKITKNGELIGYFGEIHPLVMKNYDLGVKTYVGKVIVNNAFSAVDSEKSYKPLPKFPASTRDLSLICDENVPVAKIEKAIKTGCGKILEKITLFDVYQGAQIEKGKKSVSYSITLRSHNETLTDKQADKAVSNSLKELEKINVAIRL